MVSTAPQASAPGPMAGNLSREQIDQYRELGYVLLEDLIDPETLNTLRAVVDEVVEGARGLTEHSEYLDLEPTHRPDDPRVRRIKKPHTVHPFFRQIAAYEPMMRALSGLIGPNIRLRPGGKVNMKLAGFGAPVEWHQDWAFYPHTNDDVLAVGILIDDMTLENGPLQVVPGSHLGPVYDHHSQGAFCGAIDTEREGVSLEGAVTLTARAGSVTVHHARLLHGSSPNLSASQRRILFYEYTAADAWPMAGIEPIDDFEEFNSRMVYGEPTLVPRLVDVPIRMPLPRAKYQGSLYENQRTLAGRYFAEQPDSE